MPGSRSGEWPYRDFWLNYPPGEPLVLALLQRAFGPSLLSWRILLLALDGLVSVLAWRLARRRAGEIWALAAWLAVAGAMAYPALPGPNPSALALVFGALLAARERPELGGALAGLACLLRIEFGLAAILAVTLTAPPGGACAPPCRGPVGASCCSRPSPPWPPMRCGPTRSVSTGSSRCSGCPSRSPSRAPCARAS